MPTPSNVNYLYIIVMVDKMGTSYECRYEIKEQVDKHLELIGLADDYRYYDFVNKPHVSPDLIMPRGWENHVHIGIARWTHLDDGIPPSHELEREK